MMKKKLRFMDRFLTLWIFLAMGLGIGLGVLFPSWPALVETYSIGSVNLPLAFGLILMMYPPLAKVDFELLPAVLNDRKVLALSLILNMLVGPFLMFGLALLFLQDQPDYMVGLILIGLARCIAMVVVWNDLAGGSREYAAMLIAFNSIFQLLMYGTMAWFFTAWFPGWIGIQMQWVPVPFQSVFESVLLYLGVPFGLAFFGRLLLVRWKGQHWYNSLYCTAISPITLWALLATIVLMFSMKGSQFLGIPLDVIQVAVPLVIYFILMFGMGFAAGFFLQIPYPKTTSLAFTAAGNNFELAIAISIAVFGIQSPQAFVGVVGPLVEVPVLLGLVHLSTFLKSHFFKNEFDTPKAS